MFSDSALSCCILLLASGSCIYLTGKRSIDNFSKVKLEIIAASIGILAINLRSLFNLLSPFIYHSLYPMDPIEIGDEEPEKAIIRVVPLHEKICRTLSMSGLTFAVYESHEYRITGIIIVLTLVSIEIYHATHENLIIQSRNRLFHFLWMIAGGFIGWLKSNYFCLVAYIPYGISFLGMPPEIDRAWSIRRIINNYTMMAHVFLMLEAIREARSIDI